jgi:hypothetical protein
MECKICLNGTNEETIINPCSCTEGVHEECLKLWILTESNTNPLVCEVCLAEYDLNYSVLFADFAELFSNGDDEENTTIDEENTTIDEENTPTNEENPSQIIAVSYARQNRMRETYVIYTQNVLSRRRNEQIAYCGIGFIMLSIIDGTLLMAHQTTCLYRDTCQQNLELVAIAVTIVGCVFVISCILDSRQRPIMDITNLYN